MYENIMKLIDEAIKDKNLLIEAYKSDNERLEKENKSLIELVAALTEQVNKNENS